MKAGTENRRKMIIAGSLSALALICLYLAYSSIFGGPVNPAITNAAATANAAAARATAPATASARKSNGNSNSRSSGNGNASAAIPGVAAERVATTSSSLDPTLDESAMLRTESLKYAGEGRNIFSATYVPAAAVVIPKQTIAPRPAPVAVQQPIQTGPPPLPPINLKYFGTATRANGQKQAFLLQGEDVYLASTGDIVARKYKIGAILPGSVQVTDLQNNNTQSLPFISQ